MVGMSAMRASVHLDHIAIAAERASDLWPRYAGDLAGEWGGGAPDAGFWFFHLHYGRRRVEVLEPYEVERSDFLRRFLDHRGPGAHHITYKVDDIHRILGELEAGGYRPVSVDLSDPAWLEAFVHPKDAPGIVVQVAQASGGGPSGPAPDQLPPPPLDRPADLVRIAHAVPSIDDASRLFVGVLAGTEAGRGVGDDHRWVDLAWEGGDIRLLEPSGPDSPLARWIGDATGRLHHLAFAVDEPASVRDAVAIGDGVWEVAPETNHGVRLRLRAR